MSGNRNDDRSLQLALQFVGVGFYIGGCIVGGVLLGLWIDSLLNTRPLFAIAGLVVGIGIAFYGVSQIAIPLIKQNRGRRNK